MIYKKEGVYQMEILKKQTYEQYQLEWMIDHGYSLADLMNSMEEYYKQALEITGEDTRVGRTFMDLFNEWQNECGFDYCLWSCPDEAIDCGECIEDEEE
jgi:hypothetical protein